MDFITIWTLLALFLISAGISVGISLLILLFIDGSK